MTINKNFKVKNGLDVTGDADVTGTVTAANFVGDGSGLSGVTSYTITDFNADLATKTTSDLTEGTNLYYTDTRSRLSLSASTNISYNNSTGAISTVVSPSFTNLTLSGDLAVNGGDITTTQTTFNLLHTTATTLNIGGDATTISIGSTAHTGTTTIQNDLSVHGSITFGAGASSLSSTTIQIDDTLISLADANTADILDVGFYAGYRQASTDYHTGLVRDASDSGIWKLFSGVAAQPTGTVDFTSATYDTLKANLQGNATNVTGVVAILNGGTGQTTATAAFNALAPSQATNSGKYLTTNGTDTSWGTIASTNPGGSNTHVQYNSSGSFAGSANMTFDGTSLTLANGATIQGVTVGKGASAVSTNTALGVTAMSSITTGGNATGIGNEALKRVTSAFNNTAVGGLALSFATTGGNNTALGYQAGYAVTTGSESVFVGVGAGAAVTTPANTTAVGYFSLANNVTGTDNTALGCIAAQLGTGSYNTAIGSNALRLATTASNTTAVGYQSLYSNTTASNNTSVGYQSLYSNTTAVSNTAIGYQAGYSNTTGSNNFYAGKEAGLLNITGAQNTIVGSSSGVFLRNGTNNSALGYNTLGGTGAGYMSGNSNTAIGSHALFSQLEASNNTAVGAAALQSNTTASNNTALGYQAGYSNTTGGTNTAVGANALYTNTTGSFNCAVGAFGLYFNTTGINNVAIGSPSSANSGDPVLYRNTTGSQNIGIGPAAVFNNTSGSNNVGIGYQSLYGNTTASRNTAVGYQAGYSTTTGVNNNFIGASAGYSNTTGDRSVYLGDLAGTNTTGRANTFLGTDSGYLVTTGASNTILGRYTGNQGGLDIRTASNWIVLSDGDGNPRARWDSSGHMTTTGNLNVGGTLTESSTRRIKENIRPIENALSVINKLQGVLYDKIDGTAKDEPGLIAEDTAEVVDNLVVYDDDGIPMGIKYTKTVAYLVEAVKELTAKINALENK